MLSQMKSMMNVPPREARRENPMTATSVCPDAMNEVPLEIATESTTAERVCKESIANKCVQGYREWIHVGDTTMIQLRRFSLEPKTATVSVCLIKCPLEWTLPAKGPRRRRTRDGRVNHHDKGRHRTQTNRIQKCVPEFHDQAICQTISQTNFPSNNLSKIIAPKIKKNISKTIC